MGFLQAGSFLAATRLAERIGLLNTMVYTHLPSNVPLAGIAVAPNAAMAIALLLARIALSQQDERVAATAYTRTARYAVRLIAPVVGGPPSRSASGCR